YLPPELFAKLLAAVIEDPSALPDAIAGVEVDANAVGLSPDRRAKTEAWLLTNYDRKHGGFGDTHRLIHADTLEWALERSRPLKRNDEPDTWRRVAATTLGGARRLIDPVWG